MRLPCRPRYAAYGRLSRQALRPCVAAYSLRALGTIVRPATSTLGIPGAASTQLVVPAGSISTPKSLDAYRSPFTSRTRSVTGISAMSYERSVHVDNPVPGLYTTSKTWPGAAGVFALKPLYETQAWFPSAGST